MNSLNSSSAGPRTVSAARDPNLDLIRATAIILVLIYHIVGMWPVTQPTIGRVAALGRHGVDLFFVLSGFLIGGLYFRELQQRGRVDGVNFWLRRAVRTMPPYFVALALVYAAVRASRGDAFDPAYLWFGQNYEPDLPFFKASWSLCVEEHAYVAMVLGLGVLVACRVSPGPVLVGICVSSALMPWMDAAVRGQFGWAPREQATHLWYGGLAMGVLASWTRIFRKPVWHRARSACRWAWPGLLALACCMSLAGKLWQPWVPFAMACGCASALVAYADAPPLPGATAWLTRSIAAISYSTYLTHGLIIHVGRLLRSRFPQVPDVVMLCLWLVLIFGVATAFYWLVERTSIVVRDLWVPRPHDPSAAA
jgi:peptidoglycan/LPS O-acetylase OafA/YrhL